MLVEQLANESFLKHKTAMERRQTTLESYKASLQRVTARQLQRVTARQLHRVTARQLQNVLDCTNMNMATIKESISEDDLNPSRFLCDKVWGDRHKR